MTSGWRKPNRRYPFTAEHDELIRDGYRRTYSFGQRGVFFRIAQTIGYPVWAVRRRGKELGLTRTKEKPWSDTELHLLQELGRYTPAVIARKMTEAGHPRSETAVMLKRKRLRIRATVGGYSAHQLAEAFGEDGHKVVRWIKQELLPAERLGTRRTAPQHGDTYFIKTRDVSRFVHQHPSEYDLAKVDKEFFLQIAAAGYGGEVFAEEATLP